VDENEVVEALESSFYDSWVFFNGDKPGYTHDFERNIMVKEIALQMFGSLTHPEAKSNRFDRIYFSKNSSQWKLHHIDIVGTEPISENLFLSDHYGLKTILQFLGDPQ